VEQCAAPVEQHGPDHHPKSQSHRRDAALEPILCLIAYNRAGKPATLHGSLQLNLQVLIKHTPPRLRVTLDGQQRYLGLDKGSGRCII
jgi:hypothetical protein